MSQESAVASYHANLVLQIKGWRSKQTGGVTFVCVYRQQLSSFTDSVNRHTNTTLTAGHRWKVTDLGAPGKSDQRTTTAPSGGRLQ